ncbi:outer membrane protein [Komagataeibacter oboediens DSM 11826]|uniref:Calcium-binding protein n=1 Tax=Komagataeibacter oboediens TaxID=65958 RepID=A0A318QY02_9PROT|nr:hypothetical protein [Komagataeibacter oboediens]PYD82271.1 hypothetical protein CFR80_07295 [Komagataeibacter oboediens]GBR29865.1 outer membrane protein [Komagataeibacter oboediens DSM 11826]
MGVTVTGATGQTLGINPDSSVIAGLQQAGEAAALQSLIGGIPGADITALTQAYGGDITNVPAQSLRMLGVAGIDRSIAQQIGGTAQEITSDGYYDTTASKVVIGSTTPAPLDGTVVLDSGSQAVTAVDGDMGEVDFIAGSGDVNYYAAGGNTEFVSGGGQDVMHVMGGTDTVYAFDGTPTVTGDWNAPGGTTAFDGGNAQLQVFDGVVVQDVSNSGIVTYATDDYFEEPAPAQDTATIDGGVSDTIYGSNDLVINSTSDSTIHGDDSLTVSGGDSDTISASYSTLLDNVDASSISVSVPGTLTFIDGSKGISDTVTGSNATIFGTAGLDLSANTAGNITYYASGGNETLDGGLSTNALYAVAGNGNDTLIGGQGADTLQAGLGNDLLQAGNGTTEFDFIKGQDGGNDIIQDFGRSAGNAVKLSGYDASAGAIQSMLDNATIAGGNTTVSLDDATRITFVGVTDLKAQNFKS